MAARAGRGLARLSERVRRLEPPARVPGIDLARGLAVLGMFAAHLIALPAVELLAPATWAGLADGRASIMFALLGGLSIALLTGGSAGPRASGRRAAALGIAVRAVALWGIGLLLLAADAGVAVILPAYGVLFLLAAACLTWSPRRLLAVGASLLVLAPILLQWLTPTLADVVPAAAGEALTLALGLLYPFPLWFGYVLVGMAIGRLELGRRPVRLGLAAGGVAAAALGAGLAALPVGDGWWARVLSAAPHSGGMGESIGSTGFVVALLALCLLVGDTAARHALLPLRAVGAMPLSVYVAQVLALAIAYQGQLPRYFGAGQAEQVAAFTWYALIAMLAATAWALLVGRGPLEWLMSWLPGRSRTPGPPLSERPATGRLAR